MMPCLGYKRTMTATIFPAKRLFVIPVILTLEATSERRLIAAQGVFSMAWRRHHSICFPQEYGTGLPAHRVRSS